MAPQQKGKQGTKGAKQIVEENVKTLSFYRNMAFGANALSLIALYFYNSPANIVLFLFAIAVYIASYQLMVRMAKPTFGENNQIQDSGVDLNMEGGLAENLKDAIILTAGCQLLSVISNYFWFLWLLAPIRGFYLLWKNVIGPHLAQRSAEPEVNEKKQKKIERKMRRMR